MKAPQLRLVAPIAAGVLALWGGVFFGLFSCSGYAWHRQLFDILFPSVVVIAVAAPPWQLPPWLRRGIFVISLGCGFVLTRAVASAFWPAAPTSLEAFGRGVLSGLLTGPC
jgi:hypothetical protein